MIETFDLGDIRLGADIKIKCTGCGRIIMLPRSKFQKDAKKIVNL